MYSNVYFYFRKTILLIDISTGLGTILIVKLGISILNFNLNKNPFDCTSIESPRMGCDIAKELTIFHTT